MSEIELILTKLKIVSEEKGNGMYLCDKKHSKILLDYIQQKDNIIKEVREYIKDKWGMELKDSMEDFLDHDELIDKKRLLHILEILDKENKE